MASDAEEDKHRRPQRHRHPRGFSSFVGSLPRAALVYFRGSSRMVKGSLALLVVVGFLAAVSGLQEARLTMGHSRVNVPGGAMDDASFHRGGGMDGGAHPMAPPMMMKAEAEMADSVLMEAAPASLQTRGELVGAGWWCRYTLCLTNFGPHRPVVCLCVCGCAGFSGKGQNGMTLGASLGAPPSVDQVGSPKGKMLIKEGSVSLQAAREDGVRKVMQNIRAKAESELRSCGSSTWKEL
jgi:hypothetical protein